MNRFVLSILIVVIVTMTAAPAWAAKESREKQMLRRLQQQMQQIEQARAQAEQEKATALSEKETAERELEKIRSDTVTAKQQLSSERSTRSRMERELQALKTENRALKTQLVDTEKKFAESTAQQRTTAQTLAQAESAKKQTVAQLAGKERDLDICQSHNGKLYMIGREMMQKYRDKSCADALAQAEPFTGLKKVEVENLLETWRDRLDKEKLDKSP